MTPDKFSRRRLLGGALAALTGWLCLRPPRATATYDHRREQLPLTYRASGLPSGLSIDPSSALISGTPDAAAETNDGVYKVTVLVSDGPGNNGSASFAWNVTRIN